VGNKLDAFERENMIGVLEWRIGWSYEALKMLNNDQLLKLWKERVENDKIQR
jgi:hypothetical protein